MRSKLIIGTAVSAAVCAGMLGWRTAPRAIADAACGSAVRGGRLVTVDGGRLTDGHGGLAAIDDPGGAYRLRQVAVDGDAVAYVRDEVGDDSVVIARPGGPAVVLAQRGEVVQPAWGRGGALAWGLDDDLVLRAANGAIRRIPGPQPGGQVIAPTFDDRGVVVAVAAGPTTAAPEGGWSDDIWRFVGGRWHRLTRFPAGVDRWTAIRTVMTAPDGSVEFVVVQGRASATELPRFALWRLVGDRAELLRRLPSESYLAGFDPDGRPLWNVPDRAHERWLVRDDDGALVGCGGVAVDPMDRVDPDRTGRAAPAPSANRDHAELGDPAEVALLVGDFARREAAAVVADRLTRAYEGAFPVDLLRGGSRSSVVRPGSWGVVVRLGANTDGVAELAGLRALVPDLAAHTWIVVP
jgi:Lipoprotein LpqB beta-propeller domain